MAGRHLAQAKVFSFLVRRELARASLRPLSTTSSMAKGGDYCCPGGEQQHLPLKIEIGNREIVGEGEEIYMDEMGKPFPAIRWKEDTPAILKLREKEKGDWKKLTIAEKKELYRASFCQTFEERHAPFGQWKGVIGSVLICFGICFWWHFINVKFIYKKLPWTMMSEEKRRAEVERLVTIRNDPFLGVASKFDYENKRWKE